RGAALAEQDMPHMPRAGGRPAERAQFWRTAAGLLAADSRFAQAEKAMAEAIKLERTEDKLRLLGDYRFAQGDTAGAIDVFLQADQIRPLTGPGAFRLGKLLFEAGRGAEAVSYLYAAGPEFEAPVGRMLAAIERVAAQGTETGAA